MSLFKRVQPMFNKLWRLTHAKNEPASSQRSFDAAGANRLLASWARDGQSLNRQLQTELRPLRARSRQLCQNNEYAKNFINQCKINIIGANGVRLQVKSRNSDGSLDTESNDAVETAWKFSSKAREFEASRRYDRPTFERLLVEILPRDGEVLIQMLPGFDNKSQFAVRLIDADYLDETYTTESYQATGNRVRMGVEIDVYGAPVAYHLLKQHPGESFTSGIKNERMRVPATQLLHIFIPTYADQWRGIPWMHASMITLRDLGGYREAALIAARVGAAKMGFFKGPKKEAFDGTDEQGNTVMEAEAGSFDHIGSDTEFIAWDPQYPHGDFEPFNKTLLKGIAASFGVAYHNISGDLEGVNYSSGRLGEMAERDMWDMLQKLIIGQFHDLIYPTWLTQQLVSGNIVNKKGITIPPSAHSSLLKVFWQPRRWKWVDPQKEFNAVKGQIDEALISRGQAIRDRGDDPEEVWREIEEEQDKLRSMGITPGAPGFIPVEINPEDQNDNGGKDDESSSDSKAA